MRGAERETPKGRFDDTADPARLPFAKGEIVHCEVAYALSAVRQL